jgi:hypothetical protein
VDRALSRCFNRLAIWSSRDGSHSYRWRHFSSHAVPSREARNETYAYCRFGSGSQPPLVCLQHLTGTVDNWDPAVTDPLASGREVILFDSAGVGRSTGVVSPTVEDPDPGHGSLFQLHESFTRPWRHFSRPIRRLRSTDANGDREHERLDTYAIDAHGGWIGGAN